MWKLSALAAIVIALSSCGPNTPSVPAPPGAPGPTGPSGADGIGCTSQPVTPGDVLPNGGQVLTCSNGSFLISNGTNGAAGSTGTPGAAGTAGANGTVITALQLCSSSFMPIYPNVFPEVALCINDVLYGVYSANGGFLSPLPPGGYSSNGINASCSFTIGVDCAIQD